jgi:hypothetical protein
MASPMNAAPMHFWLRSVPLRIAIALPTQATGEASMMFCDQQQTRDDEKYRRSVQKKINQTLQKSYCGAYPHKVTRCFHFWKAASTRSTYSGNSELSMPSRSYFGIALPKLNLLLSKKHL